MAVRQIEAERVFVEHRGLLHAVAYRVLGSVTEAEDVVQDAWLRWDRVDMATVRAAIATTPIRRSGSRSRSGSWPPASAGTSMR